MPDDLPMISKKIKFKDFSLDARYLAVPDSQFVVLIAHGGTGNLYDRFALYRSWKNLGVSIFTFDYRGYGLSGGEDKGDKTRIGNYTVDTAQAFGKVRSLGWATSEILLYGEDIGATLLANIAKSRRAAAWIGMNIIPSLPAIARNSFQKKLVEGRFEIIDSLSAVRYPKWAIQGAARNVSTKVLLESLSPKVSFDYVCEFDTEFSDQKVLPEPWMNCMRKLLNSLESSRKSRRKHGKTTRKSRFSRKKAVRISKSSPQKVNL